MSTGFASSLTTENMPERLQRLHAVADDLGDGEQGDGEEGAGDAPDGVPEEQADDHDHRVEGEPAGEQQRRDGLALENVDQQIEGGRQEGLPRPRELSSPAAANIPTPVRGPRIGCS